jgi:4a-hydroxytetrahydrobiopterin dehydratase
MRSWFKSASRTTLSPPSRPSYRFRRMTDAIIPREFHESEGVDDWRVLVGKATAYFRTGSFVRGVELIDAISVLAEAANHHPDVDLRYSGVTVRLSSHDVQSLSRRDVALAKQISLAARDMGVSADPTVSENVQITIDATDIASVRTFWRAVLGYQDVGDEDLVDPRSIGPSIWFQQMDVPRTQRNRVHIDVSVPHDTIEARVTTALAGGGRLVTDEFAPRWWVLADPEGNEACLASWLGKE